MFCGNCGTHLSANERFCGECGQPAARMEEQHPAPAIPNIIPNAIPRAPMSRRAKITTLIIVGVVGLAAAGYAAAHYTYGPSTPEKLEASLQTAVASHNVEALLKDLNPASDGLKKADIVAAFTKAFNGETASNYKSAFQEALSYAKSMEAAGIIDDSEENMVGNGPGLIEFVREKSWRGTKWSFKVTPVALTFEKQGDWTAVTSLETLKEDSGTFSGLWPAVYAYQSEVSNKYGGKQTITGSIDLFDGPQATIRLADYVQGRVVIAMPSLEGVSFLLNGVPFPQLQDGESSIMIAPAPAQLKVEAKGTYLGMTIDKTETLAVSENDEADLSTLVRQAVADRAMDLLLKANVSWTKAYNAGNVALMSGFDPNGDAYQSFSQNMYEVPDVKLHLVRLAIRPSDILLSADQLQVTASEEYDYPGTDRSNDITSNTYVITRQPDKAEWWLSKSSHNYWGDNLFGTDDALIKTNEEKFEVVAPQQDNSTNTEDNSTNTAADEGLSVG